MHIVMGIIGGKAGVYRHHRNLFLFTAFPSQALFSPLLTRVSMPPVDTAKRSLQSRSSPSVARKPYQTRRPSDL